MIVVLDVLVDEIVVDVLGTVEVLVIVEVSVVVEVAELGIGTPIGSTTMVPIMLG